MANDYQGLLNKFVDAMFVRHDPNAAAQVYTEDAVYWEPFLPEPIKGRQAIAEYLAGFVQAFPDLSAEKTNSFGTGEWFAAELRATGTNTGPLEVEPGKTIPATGKRFEMPVCWVGRVTPDGLCAEDRTYYDVASFLRQLGLAPS